MLNSKCLLIIRSVKPVIFDNSVRCMSRVKYRFTMPPFWQPKKTRVQYPEAVTSDNQEFITEYIEEKYKSPLKAEIYEKGQWAPNSYRCGLIAKKIGEYPIWRMDGKRMTSTLLHVSDNHVIKYIPPEELSKHHFLYKRRVQRKDRPLAALVVGADSADPREFTKEYFNLFENSGVMPKRRLSKFFITPNARLPIGFQLSAAHFRPGDFVDCNGITVDRGFQGVMKRWGFKGNKASHGVTKSHRRPGNIGGGGGAKARVWPGTKLPGHMGRRCRTQKNLEVLRVNTKYNVIWVKGRCVPGEPGNYVIMYDAVTPIHDVNTLSKKLVFPTCFPEEEELLENFFHEKFHDFRLPSITFEQEKDEKS